MENKKGVGGTCNADKFMFFKHNFGKCVFERHDNTVIVKIMDETPVLQIINHELAVRIRIIPLIVVFAMRGFDTNSLQPADQIRFLWQYSRKIASG